MTISEDNLTESQVRWLFRIIKRPSNLKQLETLDGCIKQKSATTIRQNVQLAGEKDFPGFVLFFNCDDMLNVAAKYSMHLRFARSNIQFVRLDVDGFHLNPDGQYVRGEAHIHYYTPSYQKHDAVAFALPDNVFHNVHDVYLTWREFLKFVNVVFEEAK